MLTPPGRDEGMPTAPEARVACPHMRDLETVDRAPPHEENNTNQPDNPADNPPTASTLLGVSTRPPTSGAPPRPPRQQ